MKKIRDIYEEELTWSEMERLFWKKYLSERYYEYKENEFYVLKMDSMTNDEYTSKFLELLRYVPLPQGGEGQDSDIHQWVVNSIQREYLV